MNITVELVDRRWCVVEAGRDTVLSFASGAAAFEAAADRLRAAARGPGTVGPLTVRAFGTSVETMAVV